MMNFIMFYYTDIYGITAAAAPGQLDDGGFEMIKWRPWGHDRTK